MARGGNSVKLFMGSHRITSFIQYRSINAYFIKFSFVRKSHIKKKLEVD